MGAVNLEDEARKEPGMGPPAPLEVVRGYEDEENPLASEGGGWRVQSVVDLDWAMKRLAAHEATIAENEEMAAERHAEIDRRLLRLNDNAMKGVRRFRQMIEEYAQTHRDELLGGGKKKSRSLLHGTVGWRQRGGGLEVVDAAALLAWAQSQPIELGLTRMKEEPCLTEIKAVAKRDAVVPPGMQMAPLVDELQIRVDLKEVL